MKWRKLLCLCIAIIENPFARQLSGFLVGATATVRERKSVGFFLVV